MDEPGVLRGLVLGLHHIAIAVADLTAARGLYVDQLGLAASEVERVADQDIEVGSSTSS